MKKLIMLLLIGATLVSCSKEVIVPLEPVEATIDASFIMKAKKKPIVISETIPYQVQYSAYNTCTGENMDIFGSALYTTNIVRNDSLQKDYVKLVYENTKAYGQTTRDVYDVEYEYEMYRETDVTDGAYTIYKSVERQIVAFTAPNGVRSVSTLKVDFEMTKKGKVIRDINESNNEICER